MWNLINIFKYLQWVEKYYCKIDILIVNIQQCVLKKNISTTNDLLNNYMINII